MDSTLLGVMSGEQSFAVELAERIEVPRQLPANCGRPLEDVAMNHVPRGARLNVDVVVWSTDDEYLHYGW